MDLTAKSVMITAGPTVEPIDPVRFISNRSSGKMGYALAQAFVAVGAKVTLVSGPTKLTPPEGIDSFFSVQTAAEMFEACQSLHSAQDVIIFSAAVADYTPDNVATQKIKKQGNTLELTLKKTVDIAQTLGKLKQSHQLHIGFALETENEAQNAADKLARKSFDAIVLNSLNDSGAGFAKDTNKVTIIDKDNSSHKYELKSKLEVAQDIVRFIIDRL